MSRRFKATLALALALALSAAALANAEVEQRGSLRVNVTGKITPHKLPREGAAPIAVSVGWNISTTDESPPPQLKTLKIEINRNGRFDFTGLPVCPQNKIQPATTARALANCRSALVGKGSFSALIALQGQESYVTEGRLLVFNGLKHGKPVLLGQIYSPHPFATSFVITFAVKEISHGAYGTALTATLPKALRSWGNLTGIEMKLSRRFGYKGHRRSFLSAGCAAPKGTALASYRFARASFAFSGAPGLGITMMRSCRVRH